jgi:hypothetical protein
VFSDSGFIHQIGSTVSVTVKEFNTPPTDLVFTTSGVQENSVAGTVIGTLAGVDPDAGSTFSYAMVAGNGINDADNNLVEIVGNEVRVKSGAVIDFETNPVINLNIRVTDNGNPGLTFAKAVTAAVIDVLEIPPDITAPTVSSISTHGTTVIVKFSEAIISQSVPTTAFAVATLNSSNQATARTLQALLLLPTSTSGSPIPILLVIKLLV